MTILEMFKKCAWGCDYVHTEVERGSYFVEKKRNTLYLYLQGSKGDVDWRNNFDFGAEPYKDMPIRWKAHRGFVRVWKEIEPAVKESIMDPTVKKINIIGYSHGAALAVLAHEYAWFNRPDIRDHIFGYGFEAPRVFRGKKVPDELAARWENFYIFRNGKDLVTRVPPRIFGYKHVGTLVQLNKDRSILESKRYWLKCIDEHDAPNVIAALKAEGFGEKKEQTR